MNISPYDLRQYRLMHQNIEGYQNERLSLNSLVNNLEGLSDSLENPGQVWREEFRTLCNDLEMIHAISLDEGKGELDSIQKEIIVQTLSKLKYLIEPLILAGNTPTED